MRERGEGVRREAVSRRTRLDHLLGVDAGGGVDGHAHDVQVVLGQHRRALVDRLACRQSRHPPRPRRGHAGNIRGAEREGAGTALVEPATRGPHSDPRRPARKDECLGAHQASSAGILGARGQRGGRGRVTNGRGVIWRGWRHLPLPLKMRPNMSSDTGIRSTSPVNSTCESIQRKI